MRTDGGACFADQCLSELQAERGLTLGPEIFGPCRSKAVEDPCRVNFVKL